MTLEGIVESRNERGIKLEGEWRNMSKFHPLELPDVGSRVRAEVDPKGFLRSVDVLEGTARPSCSRDERITRLAVLKAAASFAAPRAEIRSADVLAIAERWLLWVGESNGS